MSPFLYLMKRSFINYLKSFKNKPSKAIPYIFFLIILGFTFFPILFEDETKTLVSAEIFIGILTFISIALLLSSIYNGINRKNFSYSMADVNLFFTAPIKQVKILIYGFIKEIGLQLFIGIFLLFQIPMLVDKFGLSVEGFIILFLLLILICISSNSLSLMIYAIFTNYPKGKPIAKKLFIFILCILVVYIAYPILNGETNLYTSFFNIFNSSFLYYIPLIGFYRLMAEGIFIGFSINLLLSIIGIIFFTSLFVFILCKLKLDFYEDVISSAETKEAAMNYKNSGYDMTQLDYTKIKYKPWTRKNVKDEYTDEFAKAIFKRHLLEYKKTGFYFLNLSTLFLLVCAVAFALFIKSSILIFLCISVYFMSISSNSGKWSLEFNNPSIFLIPDSSEKKLFYSTLTSILKLCIDGILVFSILGILIKADPFEVILCIITYISFGFLCTYGGVFNYKLFDRVSNQLTKGFIMLFSMFIYILPSILIGLFISIKLNFLGSYAIYFGILLYNIIASILLIKLSKGIYDTIEL